MSLRNLLTRANTDELAGQVQMSVRSLVVSRRLKAEIAKQALHAPSSESISRINDNLEKRKVTDIKPRPNHLKDKLSYYVTKKCTRLPAVAWPSVIEISK